MRMQTQGYGMSESMTDEPEVRAGRMAHHSKAPFASIFTVIAAVAAATAVMATPVGLLEMVTSSIGLSEILPMAAPPLGMTARMSLAASAAILAAALVWVIRRNPHQPDAQDDRESDDTSALVTEFQGEKKMGFAMPKFMSSMTRARAVISGDTPEMDGALARRRADAHPDAPPRRPIFARSDLANTTLLRPKPAQRSFESEADPRVIISAEGLRMPAAPEPMAVEVDMPVPEPVPEPLPLEQPVSAADNIYAPMGRAVAEAPEVSERPLARPALENLDITALADRFEQGLARRVALAGAAHASQRAEEAMAMTFPEQDPVASPAFKPSSISLASTSPAPSSLAAMPVAEAVPVKPNVDAEIDQALRAALGTLQRMTARAG